MVGRGGLRPVDVVRRRYLVIGLALIAAGVLLIVLVVRANAQPARCVAVVDGATVDLAAQELVRYQTALQADVLADATMGHVVTLGELVQDLREAQRMGCDVRPGMDPEGVQ